MGLVIGVQSLVGSQSKSSKPNAHECPPSQTQPIACSAAGQWVAIWRGRARQGKAGQGWARQTHCPLEQFRGQKFGLAWPGKAGLGRAGQGEAGHGKHTAPCSQGAEVWHGLAGPGLAGLGWAWQTHSLLSQGRWEKFGVAGHGLARHGTAGRGTAWRGAANTLLFGKPEGRSLARHGAARHGLARRGRARPGKARLHHRGSNPPEAFRKIGQQKQKK